MKPSYIWETLRSTYWFLPAMMVIASIALAFASVSMDRVLQSQFHEQWGWTYTGSAEGARAVLSTIAGSMITVAATVFSITIVALSLASGQFGPRLLRNFIRDRKNQFVLGIFLATFTFCVLVLRTVRGTDIVVFVPGVSVALGILLALFGIGVLIYFIHHVAISIQVTHVVAAVNEELHESINRLWPDELGDELPESLTSPTLPANLDRESSEIPSLGSGYVDAIDDDSLLSIAQERDLIIRLSRRPGHFVVKGNPIAFVYPSQKVDEELTQAMNRTFLLARQRTPFQDVEFAVDQLVEVAVRALSPGINDPFTAITCIDQLGEALCLLAGRKIPSSHRYDDENHLRVITQPPSFAAVVNAAFNQIRQYGRESPAVLIRMLETLAIIADHVRRQDDRSALQLHAELILRACARAVPEEMDRKDVEERYASVQIALQKTTDQRAIRTFPVGP